MNTTDIVVGMDLPPAFAALAGVKRKYPFDGVDVSDAFLGKPLRDRRQPIMWQRPPDRKLVEGKMQPDLAIRDGNFKLLINTDGSQVRLYNLHDDPEESRDISTEHPDHVKRLSGNVRSWYATLPGLK